jgi:hypothetical protein
MQKIILFFLLPSTTLLTSFSTHEHHTGVKMPVVHASIAADTTYQIIAAPGNTYGYEILIHKKVLIRQLNIPGRSGTAGFKRKADAEKVARLVIKKLSQGMMPPTVDENELKQLNIKM